MATTQRTGVFQSIEISPGQVLIKDQIHGTHLITEPVLVELLQCPAVQRLIGVCQHGITDLLGLTPKVTRFEHSVGAFLLVRMVGASLGEQIAALLHDISHTVLSHVMDWALSTPQDSFHEVAKDRYVKTTELPSLLTKHGYGDFKVLDEELFPLVETPSPHLCADRLDYGLRDTVAFAKLDIEDARRVVGSLRAYPDANSPARMLVLQSQDVALKLAQAYKATDRDAYSDPANVDMNRRAGFLIGDMVRAGKIKEDQLWSQSDEEFWEALREAADAAGRETMRRLEVEGYPDATRLGLPRNAKVRSIDPDLCLNGSKPVPLSVLDPTWAAERKEYLNSRDAMRKAGATV